MLRGLMSETENNQREITRIKLRLHDLISKQLSTDDCVPINTHEIRNYIYYGFSDNKLRPRYWKVLLNYYSPNKFKTEHFYRQARQSYNEILERSGDGVETAMKTIRAELQRTAIATDSHRCIERILTAFSIVNPGIGYVQGMIALVNVLYHVLSQDDDIEAMKFAEEDTFYLFNNLISETSNLFIDEFDNQQEGIRHKITQVFDIVRDRDPELYEALVKKGILKTMFPLKWILLLFSTEYEIDEVVWLWDKILSDSYRFEILEYCAAAVIILMRDILLTEDYDRCLAVLQKPSMVNPRILFDIADIMRRDKSDVKKIIEERISRS